MARDQTLTPVEALAEEATERRSQDQERLSEYKRYLNAIFGKHRGSVNRVIGSYADGRPSLRLATAVQDNWNQREPINLLPSMVDTFVSLRGLLPTARVLPESGEEPAQQQATKRTRALREQYSHSKFDKSFKNAAFYLVALGDACLTADPWLPADRKQSGDKRRPVGVYISVIDPANAFPRFRFGEPGDELQDLYCIWNLDADSIYDAYNVRVDQERADVIHYYSRHEKQIVVGGRNTRVSGVYHDLGFVPAQWLSNKATDGRSAQSDIRNAIDIHEQLGVIYNIYLDSLMWATWPIIHVREAAQVSQPEIGPGATIETVGNGMVELLSPQGTPQNALQMIGALTDALHQATGVSPIQTHGVIDRSNVSGRSVDRQQGPMEQRIVFQSDLVSDGLEAFNEKLLLMLSSIDGLKDEQMPMYGQERATWTGVRSTYSDTFSGADIGGWTRNEVKWDPLLGSSRHERLVQALQLHKESGGVFPITRAIREFGDDDPQQTLEEGIAEAKMLMASQPQPGPGGPGGAPGGASPTPTAAAGPGPMAAQPPTEVGAEGAGMLQGGLPQSGNPSMPGGNGAGSPSPPLVGPSVPPFSSVDQAPTQPGMGTPAPVPNVIEEIQAVLDAIAPQLRGTATIDATERGWRVLVSDHRDTHTVRQALTEVWRRIFGPTTRPEVKAVSTASTQR